MKPILDVLHNGNTTVHPIWLMRQAGRYLPEYRAIRQTQENFLSMCYTPDIACEITLQPIRRFGFDAAILFSDILVVPDAMGMDVSFVKGEGPKITPIRSLEDFQAIIRDQENFLKHLQPVMEAIGLIRQSLPKETTLIGFAGSPWTVATYMIEGGSSKDFRHSKRWIYSNRESYTEFLSILTDYTVQYLLQQIQAGAEVLQLFDSWAGILPKEEFIDFCIKPNASIVKQIRQQYPDIPIIGFPRGASIYYPDYVAETNVTAVGVDSMIDMHWMKKHIPAKTVLQGNLDPIALLGSKDTLKRKVMDLLEAVEGRAHIINLGHGIIPETPIEHVEYLLKLIRS